MTNRPTRLSKNRFCRRLSRLGSQLLAFIDSHCFFSLCQDLDHRAKGVDLADIVDQSE